MLTPEQNEFLTRVGLGAPAGELLRRYWHPVAAACELTLEKPIKEVRILGEDLTVFRMPPAEGGTHPTYGLVGRQCPHRLASFQYGRVDCEGIRCPYHGWKFAPSGQCIEQPAEPAGSTLKDRVKHVAYPVQRLAGLLFAYLGPQPAPLLPRYDVFARRDGRRWGVVESVMKCNWLQAMENSVDPAHLFWLHGTLGSPNLPVGVERFAHLGLQANYDEKNEFFIFEHGIQKKRTTKARTPGDPDEEEQHPLVFPLSLRLMIPLRVMHKQGYKNAQNFSEEEMKLGYMHHLQVRVPIDDHHTRQYQVNFLPSRVTRGDPQTDDVPFEFMNLRRPDGEFNLDLVAAQDTLMWESQGALMDRSLETLGASDRGVAMLRRLLREQIELVQAGRDPMGVMRDPAKNRIIDLDTFHEPFGLRREEARRQNLPENA